MSALMEPIFYEKITFHVIIHCARGWSDIIRALYGFTVKGGGFPSFFFLRERMVELASSDTQSLWYIVNELIAFWSFVNLVSLRQFSTLNYECAVNVGFLDPNN